MAKSYLLLGHSSSTVVEWQTLDSEVKGLNNATFTGRGNRSKTLRTIRPRTVAHGRIVTIRSINLIELIDAQVKRYTEHF